MWKRPPRLPVVADRHHRGGGRGAPLVLPVVEAAEGRGREGRPARFRNGRTLRSPAGKVGRRSEAGTRGGSRRVASDGSSDLAPVALHVSGQEMKGAAPGGTAVLRS